MDLRGGREGGGGRGGGDGRWGEEREDTAAVGDGDCCEPGNWRMTNTHTQIF